jgi:predicted dehydrogenase
MKTKVRWGILGAGRIAEKFAAALNYTEGAELCAIASREAEKGKAFAAAWKASRQYTDYEALAKDPDIDIIYIATPHAFHYEHSFLCMAHGKAVLCEKPMALNYSQVSAMVGEARERELFLMEGMWTRFMPSINKAKELIDRGVIGELRHIDAGFGFEAPYDVQGRLYNRALGGGSLLDVGIYPVFLASFFLGMPSAIQSMASKAPTGVDSYCHALLQYPGGQTAHIFSAINVQTGLQAEITGTKGRLILPRPWYKSEQLLLELNSGETSSFSFPRGCNGFEYEIQEVMDCVANGFTECPALPLDFSLQMSRVVDEIGRQAGVGY